MSAKSLMDNAKGATRLTDDQVIQHNLIEATKAVANSTGKLLNAAKKQRNDAKSPESQAKLSAAASDVAEKISGVVDAASDMPGGENAKKMWAQGENLEEMAEQELLAAAAVIEEATRALLAAKTRAEERLIEAGLQDADVNEAILDAARAIAQATAALVNSASACQKEIVATGKGGKSNNTYRRDPTWARGLISAAQAVAGTVQQLVMSANDSTQGQADEEALVASSKAVAAATARLVAASRAKSDPLSTTQQRLTNAAKAVANATQGLVTATRAATEAEEKRKEEERDAADRQPLTPTAAKAKEMEAQIKILKLQKELQNAQKQLFSIRKEEYSDMTSGSGSSTTPPTSPPLALPNAAPVPAPRLSNPNPGAQGPKSVVATPVPKAKPRPSDSKTYTLAELQTKPGHLNKDKLEDFLSDEDFQQTFSMSREEFSKVPTWKQSSIKKGVGLY